MSFTYRENQNTPLTWAQLDGNFREVESVQRDVLNQVEVAKVAAESAAESSSSSQSSAELAEEMARISVVRWCGNSTTPPATRLDGSPLEISDEYGNLTDNLRYNWTGTAWVALNSSAQQLEERQADPSGAKTIGYDLAKVSSFSRTVDSALKDRPNILDYLDSAERADSKTGTPLFDASARFQAAINDGGQVDVPAGVFGIADTVMARYDCALIGPKTGRGTPFGKGATLKWIGGVENRKTMLLAGGNDVGIDPSEEMAAVTIENLYFDGQNKVGFLVYGTYVSNESVLRNLKGKGSTEYNFYFAKSWYATYEDITSYAAKNNGIAFGMPLIYADNTSPAWAFDSTRLDMNNTSISKIRAHSSGQRFSVDTPGTWSHLDPVTRNKGYGIGIGVGYGMHVEDITSERSGGANLYSYTNNRLNKLIADGYFELPCQGSGIAHGDWANIILEATSAIGGQYALRDLHLNESSGGVYTVGSQRPVKLERVNGGEFLKSLEPNGNQIRNVAFPPRFVTMDACDNRMGFYSVRGHTPWAYGANKDLNTFWTVSVPQQADSSSLTYLVWVKPQAGWVGQGGSGSVPVYYYNGAEGTLALPGDLTVGTWNLVAALNAGLKEIKRITDGGVGVMDMAITIATPNTKIGL